VTPFFRLSFVLLLLYKICGQFNERLLLWQSSDIFLYSTVIILVCFMLCWRIKYDDDDDLCQKGGTITNIGKNYKYLKIHKNNYWRVTVQQAW